ncbi:anti-sigma factor [Anatilimnocola floriformis]|uniref:anti-sigma factor n=1 Tax=Anatilimnocola floriformis TaxID=2948575 RepID=UPI0020C3DE08|nr:hypothetical protein [Anatilimnocola floriformis]
MNERNTPNDSGILEEELVAYLDGELPDAERARIEKRLASDAACQRKLAQLQKAWDLLDMLSKAEPDAEFARSTVEMVAIQQEKEVEQLQVNAHRTKWLMFAGGGVAIAASLVAGFMLASYQLNAPERQLLQDLPVIQRVDELRYAESVDFLERLRREGLFAGEGEDAI